ncbi:LOW QUALITY PROTEIN: hypothetical protein ACHAXR_003463 [Thalassiosira sp. AJA248-18]
MRKKVYENEVGPVKSLLHFFSVKKGFFDIRMVYNGTDYGLNEAVWVPHFGLPTVRQTFRSLLPGYKQCDMDDMKQVSGVDISHVRSKDPKDKAWEQHRAQ